MLLSKLNPFLAVLYSSLLLFSANCFAQNLNSPGGIRGVSLWSLDGDSSDAIGNYHSLNLLNLKASADSTIPPMEGASSLFLVLKPNFNNAVGSAFIQLGDIEIFDNLLVPGSYIIHDYYHNRNYSNTDSLLYNNIEILLYKNIKKILKILKINLGDSKRKCQYHYNYKEY